MNLAVFLILLINSLFEEFLKKKEKKSQIEKILLKTIKFVSIIFFFKFLLLIRWTDDWEGYERIFENNGLGFEYSYSLISNFVEKLKGNFLQVYQIYITLIIFTLICFIKKFEILNYSFYILLVYISFTFYIANQIRYYLSFFLFLNAIYFYYYEKNKKFIICYSLSIFFHYSVVFLIPIIFFIKLPVQKMKKLIYCVFLINLVSLNSIQYIEKINFLRKSNHFMRLVQYFHRERSSIIGVLFLVSSFLIYLSIIVYLDKKIKSSEQKYIFLYKLSYIPFMYIPLGLITIHLVYRFVLSFTLVQIICIYYQAYSAMGKRLKILFFLFAVVSVSFFTMHVLPVLIGKRSQIESIIKVYNSSKFINFFENYDR